jgi:hypothetical protein
MLKIYIYYLANHIFLTFKLWFKKIAQVYVKKIKTEIRKMPSKAFSSNY